MSTFNPLFERSKKSHKSKLPRECLTVNKPFSQRTFPERPLASMSLALSRDEVQSIANSKRVEEKVSHASTSPTISRSELQVTVSPSKPIDSTKTTLKTAAQLYNEGMKLYQAKKHKAAHEKFIIALELEKEHNQLFFDILLGCTVTEITQGEFKAAHIRLLEGLNLKPKKQEQLIDMQFQCGVVEYTLGLEKSAEDRLKEVLDMQPHHSGATEYLSLIICAKKVRTEKPSPSSCCWIKF